MPDRDPIAEEPNSLTVPLHIEAWNPTFCSLCDHCGESMYRLSLTAIGPHGVTSAGVATVCCGCGPSEADRDV